MTHGTEQHLEHAEHVQHAAHDPFDRRVAMTMAMIAAVLALVSTLSHRAHNQTLQMQGQAINAQSEAASFYTLASNQWNYYQVKKQRAYLYGSQADLAVALGKPRAADRADRADADDELHPVSKVEAKPGKPNREEIKKRKDKKKSQKAPTDPVQLAGWWRGLAADYQKEAAQIQKDARHLEAEAREKEKEKREWLHETHHIHAQADRLDMGHLGLELALVLCSVAVLAKQRGLWHAGIAIGAIGACVSLTAFVPFLM
jgi:hypothetical protein